MTDKEILDRTDICRHEPRCRPDQWFYHTVPNYRIYVQAYRWLRHERGHKYIFVSGESDDSDTDQSYTGGYTFKFLCEQEYILFVLRWL